MSSEFAIQALIGKVTDPLVKPFVGENPDVLVIPLRDLKNFKSGIILESIKRESPSEKRIIE
jgi:hypothetical protein